MQNDRGYIKWIPFNSVTNTKEILNNAAKEKNIIKMPILSDEQITINEENILNSYHNYAKIKITYYKNNELFQTTNKIIKINSIKKYITLENNKILYFSQIIYTNII